MGRKDLRYVCKGCGYKASRRGDAAIIDLNCPECEDRLVLVENTVKALKFERAKQEINEYYSSNTKN